MNTLVLTYCYTSNEEDARGIESLRVGVQSLRVQNLCRILYTVLCGINNFFIASGAHSNCMFC